MDGLLALLIRLFALCAFSAMCDMLLSSGKLLGGVKLVSGLLVVETVVELVYGMVGMLSL